MITYNFRQFLRIRFLIPALACVGILSIVAVALYFLPSEPEPQQVAAAVPEPIILPARVSKSTPSVLSTADADTYRYIFNAEAAGDWEAADAAIAKLDDKILLGHVLAERYLSKRYTTKFEELHAWLQSYSDHPEAADISRLAAAKRKNSDAKFTAVASRRALSGFGDDNGLSSNNRLNRVDDEAWNGRPQAKKLWDSIEAQSERGALTEAQALLSTPAANEFKPAEYDIARWHLAAHQLYRGNASAAYTLASASADRSGSTIPSAHWTAGIAAWQLKDIKSAARHFDAMVKAEDNLSPWEKSAAAFWLFRAQAALGNSSQAQAALHTAAAYPRTFYGIVARHQLGQSLEVDAEALPALTSSEAADLSQQFPLVKRTIALVEAGQIDLAETELRTAFPTAERDERVALLRVANALNLASTQITMAQIMKRQGVSYDAALYPTPAWEPRGGFAVEPSLVYAFARQESGFRPDAQSPGGALGLMQLMPDTARAMKDHAALVDLPKQSMLEPEINLALGQTYLSYLMKNTAASGNLIFLAAAYNAGPGKLSEWIKTSSRASDPLLFLETIPYAQTRNYVAQVLTSYWVYQELAGTRTSTALSLAQGHWPLYKGQVAVADTRQRG